MRSFIVTGALAAMVAAAPLQDRAVTVTEETDVYTTVWEDEAAAAEPTTTKVWGHGHGHGHGHGSGYEAYTTVVVTPTPEAAPAAPSAPAYSAPAAPAYSAPAAPAYSAPAYSAPAAAPSVAASSPSAPDSYSQAVLNHHNAHRANHSASALTWDAGLAATAQTIGESCVYAHNVAQDGGNYGQNIAAGSPPDQISSVITNLFYNNEEPNFSGLYGQATPSNINDESAFDGWGHFTQVVWKGTTSVGCATVQCPTLQNTGSGVAPYFTVCNYKPAGNFLGEFDTNVGQPLGQASISG